MAIGQPLRLTASGAVRASAPADILCLTLTGGSDAATAVIKTGGADGTQVWPTIKVGAGATIHIVFDGRLGGSSLYITLTGTNVECGVLYV